MLTIQEYVKLEHPEVYDEYDRYKRIQESDSYKMKGTKVVTLVSGYNGFGGQELIVLGIADWNEKGGVDLIDINGKEYGCDFADFHKKMKVVDCFENDWNLDDIEIEDE